LRRVARKHRRDGHIERSGRGRSYGCRI
jgi:hypothetical protein